MNRHACHTSVIRCAFASIWTVLLVLVVFRPVAAQVIPHPAGYRVSVMHYTNASGERGHSDFHYGRDGRMLRAFWTLEDGSRFSGNLFVYDAHGRRLEQRRSFSDTLTSLETYAYDAAGRCTGESYSRSDGRTGTIAYTRDAAGDLVGATCRNYKGWLTCDIAYTNAEAGPVVASLTRDGAPYGEIRYDYDAQGRLASETWDFGGRWSQTFSYVYEPVPETVYAYASPYVMMNPGFRVESEDYIYDGRIGGPSRYTYDTDGRLVEKVFERSDGVRTVTTYDHTPTGDLAASHRRHDDGTTTDFTYDFDARGRLVERLGERSDGIGCREVYVYDDDGRLDEAVYENMDFWLSGRITFTHDLRGHLVSGRFEGDGGFDADLVLETDRDGNVTRMHWAFSHGESQTHTFGYASVRSPPTR